MTFTPPDSSSPKRAVLSVDPGLTTGWAVLYPGENPLFLSGEIRGALEFLDVVDGLLQNGYSWDVVVERYTVTPETIKKSRQYDPLEIIGALRFMCHQRGIPFHMQTPADAKGFSSDHKLKRVGWHRIGLGHANDAARHLLLFSVKAGLVDPEDVR